MIVSNGFAQFDGSSSYIEMTCDSWMIMPNPAFTISFQFQIPISTTGYQTMVHRRYIPVAEFMLTFNFASPNLANVLIQIMGQLITIPVSVPLTSGIVLR